MKWVLVLAWSQVSGFKGDKPHDEIKSPYVLLGISTGKTGVKKLVFNDNGKVTPGPVIEQDVIWLRTENTGERAFYEYSLDGQHFERFGSEFTLTFGRWRGDRPGFYCWNNLKASGHIDIDYFHYEYDGPKPMRSQSNREALK